jgi:hypothetical protein
MAETPQKPSDGHAPFIREIVKDSKNVPDLTLLYGYLGDSSEADHERLYLQPDLGSYVEIPTAAIVHRAVASKEADPHGGVTLWVQKDAKLQSKMAPAQQALAQYFVGAIQGAAAVGAAGAGPVAHPTPTALPTHFPPCLHPTTTVQPTNFPPCVHPTTTVQVTNIPPCLHPTTTVQPTNFPPCVHPTTTVQVTNFPPCLHPTTTVQPTNFLPCVHPTTTVQPTNLAPCLHPTTTVQPTHVFCTLTQLGCPVVTQHLPCNLTVDVTCGPVCNASPAPFCGGSVGVGCSLACGIQGGGDATAACNQAQQPGAQALAQPGMVNVTDWSFRPGCWFSFNACPTMVCPHIWPSLTCPK